MKCSCVVPKCLYHIDTQMYTLLSEIRQSINKKNHRQTYKSAHSTAWYCKTDNHRQTHKAAHTAGWNRKMNCWWQDISVPVPYWYAHTDIHTHTHTQSCANTLKLMHELSFSDYPRSCAPSSSGEKISLLVLTRINVHICKQPTSIQTFSPGEHACASSRTDEIFLQKKILLETEVSWDTYLFIWCPTTRVQNLFCSVHMFPRKCQSITKLKKLTSSTEIQPWLQPKSNSTTISKPQYLYSTATVLQLNSHSTTT